MSYVITFDIWEVRANVSCKTNTMYEKKKNNDHLFSQVFLIVYHK